MGGVVSSPVKGNSFLLGRKTRERRPLETNKIEKGRRKTYGRKKRGVKKHENEEKRWVEKVGW